MLKPTKMTKVLIVGTKEIIEPTISTLHNLNLLHITDYSEDTKDFKIGRPLKQASKHSEHLLSLRAISNQLGITQKEPSSKQNEKTLSSKLDTTIITLQKEVTKKFEELRNIEFKIKEKEDQINILKPFFALPLPLESYHGYDSIKVFTGTISIDINSKISEITPKFELFSGDYEKKTVFALIISKEFEENVQKVLQNERSYVELKAPDLEGNPPIIKEKFEKEISVLKDKQTSLRSELDNLKKEYSEFILSADEYLSIETQKAEAPLRFATSANSFVIDGWIPTDKYSEVESKLNKSTNGLAYITKIEENVHDEDIPIKLDNPKAAKPYELLIDTFATPKYKEIDPSFVIFITFPLFYALMLGDIGYGIIVAAMALAIKNKFKTGGLNSLASILIFSGVLSAIFGIIYGEFFGFPIFNVEVHGEIEQGILGIFAPTIAGFHLPIHRFDAVQPLLLATLVIGILHMLLGLIMGFRNIAVEHDLKHAILEKGSWIMILLGGVAAVGTIMPPLLAKTQINTSDPIFTSGIVIAIVGTILLVKGEGPLSLMELPTLLSNVFSYARILAIGLSSAGIALAVNTLSRDLFIKPDGVWFGGGYILALVGLLVMLIGHLINLILGIIGPGLHSLRLQYVEFFTKFYKGGGKKYVPFGYIKKYMEE